LRHRREAPAVGEDSEGRTGAARALPLGTFAGALALHGAVWAAGPVWPVSIYSLAGALWAAGRLAPERVADFSPFTFHLHAALAGTALGGGAFLHGVEIVAAAATAALFSRLCLELFALRVAAAGALLFVLSPGQLVLPHLFLPEVWRLLFDVGGLLALVVYRRTRRLPLAAASGLLFGLSTATRPVALAVVFAIAAALLAIEGRRAWRASILVAAGPVLFLGLIAARNRALTGRLDPTVMDPGPAFYGSNNPASRGTFVDSPLLKQMEEFGPKEPDWAHVLYKRFAAAASGRPVTAREASRYWSAKAVAFLARHPRRAFGLAGEKVGLLVRSWEAPDSISAFELLGRLSAAHVPFVPFSLLAALALVGLWACRSRVGEFLPLLAGAAAGSAGLVAFYVNARMRAPLAPYAVLFACAALAAARGAWRGRTPGRLAAGAAAVLVLAVLFELPMDAEQSLRHAWQAKYDASLLRANASRLRNEGKREEAAVAVTSAVSEAPFAADDMTLANLPYPAGGPRAAALGRARAEAVSGAATPDRLFDLGVLLLDAGDREGARGAFAALELSGRRFDRGGRVAPAPAFHLARIAEAAGGDRAAAERLYRSALRTAPGDAATLAHLTVLLEEDGRPAEAAVIRDELFAVHSDVDAAFALGAAFLERGHASRAAPWLSRVAAWLPDFRGAQLLAAVASAESGDLSGGVARAETAFALREDPAPLEGPVLALYERAAREEPTSAETRLLLGRALRRYGRFGEARERLTEALALDPSLEPARRELTLLERAGSRP
jgi:tetratricopeptide (TPR) repeat protein